MNLVPEMVSECRATGIKREVRCKSGAIPVAVSSNILVQSAHHCRIINQRWEGIEQGTSQKTCQINQIIRGFRVKGMECKVPG